MRGARQKEKGDPVSRQGFYFMEVCDQLQAVNIVLREKDIPLHVFIQPGRIITQSYSGDLTTYDLTLQVDTSSCSLLRYKTGEGVAIRLQIRSMEEVPPADISMGTLVERLSDAFERLNGQPCSCGCRTCGMNLLKDNVKFTRVLSLPSEHWEDLSSSWTCCSHAHGKDSLQSNPERLKIDEYPFVPRIGEIFENDFSVIFYPNAIVRNNIRLVPPDKDDTSYEKKWKHKKSLLKCGRCYSVIGEAFIVDSDTVRTYNLYKSSVEFRSFYDNNMQPIFSSAFLLERVLANELANEVKTNATYRFIVQDEKRKPFLMIQVLSTYARVRFDRPHYDTPNDHEGNPCRCVQFPRRYLGSEEWELEMPRVKKEQKERAIENSEKFVLAFKETSYHLKSANGNLKRIIKKLVPPDVWSLHTFSPNLLTVRPTCDYGPTEDHCRVERVVKAFYATATTDSGRKVAQKWLKNRDCNVRLLTFPYSICMEVLLSFISSTLSLPMRRIALDDFVYGILRLE